MTMTAYITEIKRQFRDTYKFVPSGGTEHDPLFDNIPDGVYPMEIEGKIDYVKITGESINCCNFEKPEEEEGGMRRAYTGDKYATRRGR